MTGRWLQLLFVLALLVISVHFMLEWRHAGVGSSSEQLLPPALPLPPAQVNSSVLEDILAHNVLDQHRGRVDEHVGTDQMSQNHADHTWKLLAIAVQQLHEPIAVILVADKMQSLHEGDMLPDGAQLARVMKDGITVEEDGKERNVYLFGKK